MNKITSIAFTLSLLLLFTTGCSLSLSRIGLPLDNDLVQLGIGCKFLPKADHFTLLRVSPLWLGDDFVALANISAISTSDTNNGVAVGGVLVADEGFGLSAGLIDHNSDHIGVRIGGVVSGRQRGLQVGLFNQASADSWALQLGLLNFVEGSPYPIPLINWAGWSSEDASSSTSKTAAIH